MVYGGGGVGLMGETARACIEAGGAVLGVIPEFLVALEGAGDIVESRVVGSMHERKMIMYEEADAFLIMPGGVGTLEELVETLSWAHLELHAKPIVMVDIAGYWRPWFALLDHMIAAGFLAESVRGRLCRAEGPLDALDLAADRCADEGPDADALSKKL